MEGQIEMAIYRIEAIIKHVEGCVEDLQELHDSPGNMSYNQVTKLGATINKLKKIK